MYFKKNIIQYFWHLFFRLVTLKILEIRENHLKTLPKSFGRLTELERLDIGNNEFTELVSMLGYFFFFAFAFAKSEKINMELSCFQ